VTSSWSIFIQHIHLVVLTAIYVIIAVLMCL